MSKLIEALKKKFKSPEEAMSALGLNPELLRDSVGKSKSAVVVADSNPFIKESSAMKKTPLGRALMVAFSAASQKIAQDSNLPKLLGNAVKSKFDKPGIIKQLIAMDADLDPEKAGEIIDAVTDVDTSPEPVVPKTPAAEVTPPAKFAEVIEFLKTKGLDAPSLETLVEMLNKADAAPAVDADLMKPADVDAKVETAMDSMRVEFRALEAAKSAVRTTVGDVLGMDSAAQVYRFALDHLKVDHKDMPDAGLGRLFAVASERKADTRTPVIAADSASVAKIKGLDRFRNI